MFCGTFCCAFHQVFSLKCESFGSYFLSKASQQCVCQGTGGEPTLLAHLALFTDSSPILAS